ncbi:MAG: DUF2188 domain-containing protein, partial [Clostridia bacterium]|nr:DUF2188 domain-containing protein [Clostridia bacterium]
VGLIALITVIVIMIIIDVNKRKYGDDFGRGAEAKTKKKAADKTEKRSKETKPEKVTEEKPAKKEKETKPKQANEEKAEKKQTKAAEVKEEKAPAKKAESKPAEEKPAKKAAKVYHISKRKEDGKWQIKAAGGEKAIKLFRTQKEAIDYCKTLADNQDASIMIHKEDGSFRKLTY